MRCLPAMGLVDAATLGVLANALLLLAASIGIFVGAVWLGLRVVAPRLRRAIDRAETEDELDRDRDD